MMKKHRYLAGVSALALLCALGIGAANANPTLKNISKIKDNEGPVAIGSVDIHVYLDQKVSGVYGGNADGGEGGSADGGEANGLDGGAGDLAGSGSLAGDGGDGDLGGDARATNKSTIQIENRNVAVLSENDLYAVNDLYFYDFIDTGDNDPDAEGGEAEGGDGGEANGGDGGQTGQGGVYAGASNGGEGGAGGADADGGHGGKTKSGKVKFTTGDVNYGEMAMMNAGGQFNVGASTAVAATNQGGNAVAAHVPVKVNTGF